MFSFPTHPHSINSYITAVKGYGQLSNNLLQQCHRVLTFLCFSEGLQQGGWLCSSVNSSKVKEMVTPALGTFKG